MGATDVLVAQREIWARLYGPTQSDQLIRAVEQRLASEPGADVAAVCRELEPEEDEDDYDVIGRPGFG